MGPQAADRERRPREASGTAPRPAAGGVSHTLLQLQRTAGNQATVALLRASAPPPAAPTVEDPAPSRRDRIAGAVRRRSDVVRRHPGKEGHDGEHGPDAHADPEDKLAHDPPPFEEMDSVTFANALKARATDAGAVRDIDVRALPAALRDLIRFVQMTVTEIERTLAGKVPDPAALETLKHEVAVAARSWHDDSGGKLPKPTAGRSPRAEFFGAWRAKMAADGNDVPAKQRGKDVARSVLPYREITCVGWRQAEQLGRLIYDPIDDVFYLTCLHYDDDKYFRIQAPRTPVAAATGSDASSAMGTDLVLRRAWAIVAAEIDRWAAAQGAAVAAPVAPSPLDAMSADVKRYALELFALRAAYRASFAAAREKLRAAEATAKKSGLRATLEARSKGAAAAEGEASAIPEQFAPLVWKGRRFEVGSTNGYIGYSHKGGVICPAYPSGTTVGELANRFRECVDSSGGAADGDTAIMLAGLVAETVRHPPAALEALLTVVYSSPFASSRPAFGDALPMAAGATLSTGILEVTKKEAGLSRETIVAAIGRHSKASPEVIGRRIDEIIQVAGSGAVPALVELLRAALFDSEESKAAVGAGTKSLSAAHAAAGGGAAKPAATGADPGAKPDPKAAPGTDMAREGSE